MRSLLRYLGLSIMLVIVLVASGYFTMRLIIHSEEAVTVPNLVGADVMKALEAAAGKKLNVRVEGFEYSSQVAKNHILFQDPGPGSSIKRGRDLKLVISRGPEVLLGPNLASLPLSQATFILEQNELAPGEMVRVHSRQARSDVVIAQNPPVSASLRQGQSIDILVSDGEPIEDLMVPDVRGKSAVEASLALEGVGLEQGQLSMAYRPDLPEGQVLEQRPRPGYRALRGTRVALLMNQSAPVAAPAPVPPPPPVEHLVFAYTVPPGTKKQEVRIDLVTAAGNRQLHCAPHDAGETVQVSFPKADGATLVVYQGGAEVLRKRY